MQPFLILKLGFGLACAVCLRLPFLDDQNIIADMKEETKTEHAAEAGVNCTLL